MTVVEKARVKAIEAGIPAECVAGPPTETDSTYCGEDIIIWGCTSWQATALEEGEVPWDEQYPEVQLATDVFTYRGLPRWVVWVA